MIIFRYVKYHGKDTRFKVWVLTVDISQAKRLSCKNIKYEILLSDLE